MDNARIRLLQLLHKEELSSDEKEWFLNYIENTDQQELRNILEVEYEDAVSDPKPINAFLSRKMLAKIHKRIGLKQESEPRSLSFLFRKIAVAASFIGIVSMGAYLYFNGNKISRVNKPHIAAHVFKNDVHAGTEKAILTLADGSKIALNAVKNGTISSQGNAKVIKINGKLAYNTNNVAADEVVFNTLSTPKAGRYQVELPDGTRVWLNSASSIRYPTSFVGTERKVEITGEAYFEVTKNKAMPFIVKVNNSEVRVLGTHFDIMAYDDEATVKTTLLEGSVQFTNGATRCMLKPGQQSQLSKDGQVKVVSDIDLDDAIAWKNGLFHFENAEIAVVMRQLSRWYDVNVVYSKKTDDHFFAEIPSKSSLSEVLKALELTGKVDFEIQGRQIIVNP